MKKIDKRGEEKPAIERALLLLDKLAKDGKNMSYLLDVTGKGVDEIVGDIVNSKRYHVDKLKNEQSNSTEKFIRILDPLLIEIPKAINFSAKLLEENEDNEILKEWYREVNGIHASYYCNLFGLRKASGDFEDFLEEPYTTYVLTAAIYRVIFDLVNAFEYTFELVRLNSKIFKEELSKNMKRTKEALNKEWCGGSIKIRTKVIKHISNLSKSQKAKRDALLELNILDEDDVKFLVFVWDIRNSVHYNFVLGKDIKYVFQDGKFKHTFSYKKGEKLGFEGAVTLNLRIAKRLITTMEKMVQNTSDLNVHKIVKPFEEDSD